MKSRNSANGNLVSFFYDDPEDTVDAEELKSLAEKRLNLLRAIESNKQQPAQGNFSLVGAERDAGLAYFDEGGRFNDTVSHFVLKHAFKDNEESSAKWMRQEVLLFKERIKDPLVSIPRMLQSKLRVCEIAPTVPYLVPEDKIWSPQDTYYKLALSQGICLIKKGYFPIQGFFYVKERDLEVVACELFKAGLEMNMKIARTTQITNERLLSIFDSLVNPNAVVKYESKTLGEVNLGNLQDVAERKFPPCMKRLFVHLKKDNHLKHYGRLQLGLFLKGLGLSFEECLTFWKSEFCKKITGEQFMKNYQYSIAHYFGRVGKMANYSAWSCDKIVHMAQPPDREYHGCAFRHANRGELIQILGTYGLSPENKERIAKTAFQHPQVSCLELFRVLHPRSPDEDVGRIPNAFTDKSIQYSKNSHILN